MIAESGTVRGPYLAPHLRRWSLPLPVEPSTERIELRLGGGAPLRVRRLPELR
jgi:hypothetical protein